MKTVTSCFVYAGLAIGLVILIPAIIFVVPLYWWKYFPIISLIALPIWIKSKNTKVKTVTSFFVYAGLAIGLVVLIPAVFLLVPFDWPMYVPIVLLLMIPILIKRKKTKEGGEKSNAITNKLRCKECNALLGEKFLEKDARRKCPYCGAEDAIA